MGVIAPGVIASLGVIALGVIAGVNTRPQPLIPVVVTHTLKTIFCGKDVTTEPINPTEGPPKFSAFIYSERSSITTI